MFLKLVYFDEFCSCFHVFVLFVSGIFFASFFLMEDSKYLNPQRKQRCTQNILTRQGQTCFCFPKKKKRTEMFF